MYFDVIFAGPPEARSLRATSGGARREDRGRVGVSEDTGGCEGGTVAWSTLGIR